MKCDFLIDWLEFTYMVPIQEFCSVWDCFLEDFPMFEDQIDNFILAERGMHGYTHCFMFTDEYKVLYNPNEERMGVHVIFPGHGMVRMCEMFGLSGVDDFVPIKSVFKYLNDHHCKVTRMDICYDDYSKRFTPNQFNDWMREKRIRTNARKWSYVSSNQEVGGTFYLGKRGAERFLRIYDKNYESMGAINAVRYEFEFRRDFAVMIFNKVLNDEYFTFGDLLTDFFVVVEPYEVSDSYGANSMRKSRAAVDSEWQSFLELFVKVVTSDVSFKVDRKQRVLSISRLHRWIVRQILPSLYVYRESIGLDKLHDMIDAQEVRVSKLQRQMIDKYKLESDMI